VNKRPEVFVELRPSCDGYYAKARIDGAPDGLPRIFLGVLGSRDEAISEVTAWALSWLKRLRQGNAAKARS
jgi:hypothetical protein